MILRSFARALSILVLGGSVYLAATGCSTEGGGKGGDDSGVGAGSGESSGGNTCSATCGSPDECDSLACACNDGTTVNTTACNNGCCAEEADACPDSCSEHGGWGSSSNGGGTTTSGGGGDGAEAGADCSFDSDCASGICFHVNPDDDSVQKCTINCTFGGGECDALGWECAEINGGAQYLCVQ